MKIYGFLVNSKPGINYRYHKFHDKSNGFKKLFSWIYLLWLNFAYYILFCHFLGRIPESVFYEQKKIPRNISESEDNLKKHPELAVEKYIEKSKDYDIISFDVFDTLIFRPLSRPTDLFYFTGEKLGILDFKNLRTSAEEDARIKNFNLNGHYEINLEDIWKTLNDEVGTDVESGMRLEESLEEKLCYANPFMLEVWKELIKLGKTVIVVSDMYLSGDFIEKLLIKNGFEGAQKIYVSNEYGKNKYKGDLFQLVKEEYKDKRILHIGDNPKSDNTNAVKTGIDALPYIQTNKNTFKYRPYDMSYLVGSAYRGIVNNYLYNGNKAYPMEYEYGFNYGGLFVLGYCNFIHKYCKENNIDKILFLSRDGDILIKAYNYLFPGENTEYVFWSRKAALKLMAGYDKQDYFRRFIQHKINQNISIADILKTMELSFLCQELEQINLRPDDKLTNSNADLIRAFIESKWTEVLSAYKSQEEASKKYWSGCLEGIKKATAVDIGWAGSGAMALSFLIEKVWNFPCEITGIVAGTNTIHNAESDTSESFLQSGKLVSYMFSHSHNRDLLKKHDPNKDYNVFWELLLSSPNPRFEGYYEDGPHFGKKDANPAGIMQIQNGIMDFVKEYSDHFKDFPYMLNISGRDAYAPLLAASGYKEKYLKAVEEKFSININIE